MSSKLPAKTRKSLSEHRLVLSRKIARFEVSVLDAETLVLLKQPEAVNKLVFARQELAKLRREMRELNRPYSRQLHWVSQGFAKKNPSDPKLGSHKKLFNIEFSKDEV